MGNDLTIRASHLLRGRAFTAWAYQNAPHGILWCARDDGVLLALTYVKEHQVFAWSRHHTDGAVEDLCVVNSDSRDELYMVARRTVGGRVRRYVERLAEPYRSDDMPMSRAWYADCGLRLDVGDGEPVSRLSGLAHLAGREVAVLVDGGPLDGLRVDEDGVLELPRPASVALVGLPYVGTVKSMRLNTGDQSGTGQGRRQTYHPSDLALPRQRGRRSGVGAPRHGRRHAGNPVDGNQGPHLADGQPSGRTLYRGSDADAAPGLGQRGAIPSAAAGPPAHDPAVRHTRCDDGRLRGGTRSPAPA